jgi:hypothetical protein
MLSLRDCRERPEHDGEAGELIPARGKVSCVDQSRRDKINLTVLGAAAPAQNSSKYSRCSQSDTSAWKRSISAFLMCT